MANREDLDIDDDFSELYKEYTGPPVSNSTRVQDVAKVNKRSHAGSDEEEEARDPNAVPTDFTSREAKVWEAKSKATERNWKKRKEEEMICKICVESGHFTQCLIHSSFGEAYGNDDGVRGRLSHSKSPARPVQTGISYNSSNDHNKRSGGYRTDGWGTERGGPDMQSDCKMDYPAFPQTLEELELEYKRDAMDLGRIRDKDEDEENTKHREAVREMRESYMKRLAILRGMHIKQWEEFLQLDTQRRQQRALQQLSTSGFGSYKQPGYFEYDYSGGNPHYAGGSLPQESRGRNQNSMENYPSSRSHDIYGGFQRQRPEEFRKAYNRY